MKKNCILLGFACILLAASCNNNTSSQPDPADSAASKQPASDSTVITTVAVDYERNGSQFKTMAAYPSGNGAFPVVLVVPEWWGVTDYTKSRVKQLAALGYFAMAVDMYGDGKVVSTPDRAGALATPFYKDAAMAQQHFDAALAKAKTFARADTSKIAAIGYCFGGGIVLNMARLGTPLKGVASFHGSLKGNLPPAKKNTIIPEMLICHGAADSMVKPEEVSSFKKEMDAAAAHYTFIAYPGAKHAFTNPDATAIGEKYQLDIAYNESADKASWEQLKNFLKTIFR